MKKEVIGYLISIDNKLAKLKSHGNEYETIKYYQEKYINKNIHIVSSLYYN